MTAWHQPSARERKAILERVRSIAIVGVSSKPSRPSFFVATYLLSSSCDYEVWFVNPVETEVLGHRVYPSLADLPVVPDLVDVFRKPESVPPIAEEAVRIGARFFWMQEGVESDRAREILDAAGIPWVMDRCVKKELEKRNK